MESGADAHPEYWIEYSNLQRVKHDLIRNYLNGWFPKLGFWSGQIQYFDTHAGQGRHVTGQEGSPLVALQALRQHRACSELLRRCEVKFTFIERDAKNLASLEAEIRSLGTLPQNIIVDPKCGDCFTTLEEHIERLRRDKTSMAPAFFFIDPYGFHVPLEILRELMTFPRVELFVNVIWRELNMAIAGHSNKLGMSEVLNSVFGGDDWRHQVTATDAEERGDQAIEVLKRKIDAKWATHIRMHGENGVTRYILAHFSNHSEGRVLMKECMWKSCPDGGFYARKWDDPKQQLLIARTPDLSFLENWVVQQLTPGPRKWQDLSEKLLNEIWLDSQLAVVLAQLVEANKLKAFNFNGRFCLASNPTLKLGKTSLF